MAEENKASRLRAMTEPTKAGRLRGLAGGNFFSDFKQGASNSLRTVASAFSGDPELRGIDSAPTTPDSFGGAMGKAATDALMIAIPGGAAASQVKRAADGASKLRTGVQNVVSDIGRSFSKSPTRFLATEATLGASSGAGGQYAQQLYPDSDAAQFVGEILGGVGPSAVGATASAAGRGVRKLAEYAPVTGAGLKTWEAVKRTMDARTAGSRASERFERGVSESPDVVAGRMDENLLPEAREIMTPAQLSGEPGLLSLEKSLINSSDKYADKSAEQLTKLNDIIRNSLSTRTGAVEGTQRSLEETRTAYRNLLNASVENAARKTDDDISRMLPGLPAEEANRIVSQNLTRALRESNNTESALYGLIETSAVAPTRNTTAALREAKREMGKTGRGDIPSYAVGFFDPSSKDYLGRTTTVNEMRNAQSKLREIARNARMGTGKGVNRNVARIADNLANAIVEDLALTTGGNPQAIQNAVAFSREQAEVFRQGAVGKILRTASDGGDTIPPALTLVETMGLGGPRGAQAFDDIVLAASNPETIGAMDSYLKHQFLTSAVTDGEFSKSAAQSFMRSNQGILERFPRIKSQIESVIASNNSLQASQELMKAGKYFDDPSVSKAALFIEKGPEKAFTDVIAARNPRHEMSKLISLVERDTTGEALEGLKAGFYEFLLSKADSGGAISGQKLNEIVNTPKTLAALNGLFSENELNRLQTIIRTAQRSDLARSATPSKEGIIGDELSGAVQTGLGILGAAFGRSTASRLGSGGTVQIPGIMAERFRSLGKAGLLNPAKRLVIDALQDEQLFKDVLLASVKDPSAPLSPQGVRRLNAWAISLGADVADGGMNDEE